MKKPLIAIASDGMRRVPKYQRSVEKACGEVEVLLPGAVPEDALDHLDGLLLTGGGDIDAIEFQEENHPLVGVQWHPEEFIDHGAIFSCLFESFVRACTAGVSPA